MTGVSNDLLAEQMKNVQISLQKVEAEMGNMSSIIVSLAEFKKESEFLHSRFNKLENSRNHILEDVKELQMSVNGQKTLNKILQVIFGFVSSAGLAIGLFMAGQANTSEKQLNAMERQVSLMSYQITKQLTTPTVEVNTSEKKN